VTASATSVCRDDIPDLASLYDQGRYAAAHALATGRHGPLSGWTGGTEALVFASRLAGNLGGDRLSRALILRARRRAAADPATTPATRAEAALYHAFRTSSRRGPLTLRRFCRRPGVRASADAGATPAVRADFLCLEAHVAAAFHDSDAAEALWQQAYALVGDRPWTWTERAALLVQADRYPEALEAARAALRQQAWYRPAIQQAAHAFTLLGRDDEALALLEDALDPKKGALESAAVAAQLAELYAALLRPNDVLRALDRYEEFNVLGEEQGTLWLASRRGEARLQLGDLAGSADACEPLVATNAFYGKTVPRLRDPVWQTARRVVHDVPFVRQFEGTCAPATLAALTRFWRRPAEQAAITTEICYGGTFDHQERHWAETHRWAVREFRADWPGTVALIDAGIPFTLATTAVNSGHLQALIGYDDRRGTLIIRDPFHRNQAEYLAEEFFDRYALWGPRAMALVPADDPSAVERLQAADLAETSLFDGLHRLRRAIFLHDRAAARTALDDLQTLDPAARLTFFAQRELAAYDSDDPAALRAVEGLLALFPRDGRLRLEKLTLLRRLARPAEARAWLETCAADRQNAEPNLWRELARDLSADAREHARARQLVVRSLFYEPVEAEHLRLLAELLWGERDYAEAGALFRFAATSAGTRENNWQQFFVASRHLRETDEALRLLDARFRRLGDRSSQPARTLYWALRERHEFAPASAVLDEALKRRPDDGELLLFAATAHARDGEHAAAARFLESAKGHAAPGLFSRAAAELAGLAADAPAALAHWRDVLAREPLDAEAHRAVVRLLQEIDPRGPAAAREHLDAAVASFPHAVALHELRINVLAEDPGRGSPEHAFAAAALLDVQPANVWALRECVLSREAISDLPAAFGLLDEAERLDPLSPPTHALRGRLLMTAGDLAAARAALRRALELDADLPGVLAMLLECSPTLAEKRAALDFMPGLLVSQSFVGDGILAYRGEAYPILEEPALRSQLAAILTARPDLWQAWSANVWQDADAGRLDAAHANAKAAADRFPLLRPVLLDLAAIEKIRGDDAAQVAALERALRIESANGDICRRLAAAHVQAGRFSAACAVLKQAIAAAPLDVPNQVALAGVLWQEDRAAHGAQVLEILQEAVKRAPGYGWAWESLDRYAGLLGQPHIPGELARELTASRPGETSCWLRLAQALPGTAGAALAERLAAIDRALALNPRLNEGHDLRAALLAQAGRYDEALAACTPPAGTYPGDRLPALLLGRAAWLVAQRGDLDGARAKMRAVLADEPAYQAGWQMLANWAEAVNDKRELLAAAERLAFLSPHAAMPLAYLATAQLKLGKRAEAKASLRAAIRRDPGYLYAAAKLFDLQIFDRELRGAGETLLSLQKHHPGPATLSRAVCLAAKLPDAAKAGVVFAELARTCSAPEAAPADLQAALTAMAEAGWHAAVDSALRQEMAAPNQANAEAGALWVRSRAGQGKWRGLGKAVRGLPEGEMARRARIAYLSAATECRRKWRVLVFVWRNRTQLRADTASWAQGGFALTACRFNRCGIHWLSDWVTRAGIEAWMLLNLSTCLRAARKHSRAIEINRCALALPPDQTRPKHLAWVALEEALTAGEEALPRATLLYSELAPQFEKQAQPFRFLGVLTGQVLGVRAADAAERRQVYRAALKTLSRERALVPRGGDPAIRRGERRACRRMARATHAWFRWLAACFVPTPFTVTWWGAFLILWILLNILRLAVTGR
jgi:tetratricopeptide (TPR) repeat protein